LERRNRNFLVILIAVVIAIAVFASFGLPLFYGPTPEIVLPTPQPTGQGQTGEMGQGGGVRVEVTPTTVQSVIAALSRLESYSRTVTTTLAGISVSARVWVDGGWTRTDLCLPGGELTPSLETARSGAGMTGIGRPASGAQTEALPTWKGSVFPPMRTCLTWSRRVSLPRDMRKKTAWTASL